MKIRDLDYYEPVYSGGARYNISSIYDNYPASEFTWLYDESGVAYDVNNTPYEKGVRLSYGDNYEVFIEDNSLYATIYDPSNRNFNLYVLFYLPSFPSVYFSEGRKVWLDTLRNFLGNFSEYMDALVQNSGGFPVPEGDFHPEIIRSLETKYGIDFNFDNWVFEAEGSWDWKYVTQYVFDRENYFIFKNYAKEKQDIIHDHGLIYVPTGSDMKYMVWAMVEHIDSLLVNDFLDSYRILRYGYSWATKDWAPSTIRLGIWNAFILQEKHSRNEIRNWGIYTVDEALKWNPEGATMVFWVTAKDFMLTSEQWEALKEVTQYTHDRFKHVLMLPPDVERYTVAKAYQISHQHRYGPKIDINPGQIDIYPIYVKDLKWDSVPTDGCLIYDGVGGGIIDYASRIDDTEAHEKIIQAVNNGATIAFSGSALMRVGREYYKGTNVPTMLNDMFQTERWTHTEKPGHSPHYLTFDGAFDPRHLNISDPGGYWIELKSNASAETIVGDFPYTGLYEAEFGKGNVIGFGKSMNPIKTSLYTDASSATYGDEHAVRFVEYCTGKVGGFRIWDVGKTFVYKANDSTYFALLSERYGISRHVPIMVYGTEQARIIDMDTNREIPNNSIIYLRANSTKLLMIKHPMPPKISQAILTGRNSENITLNWSLSPDDGAGLKSIVGYEIYRDTTFNPKGLGYQLIASLPSRTTSFLDNHTGEGNPNNWFYRVCGIDLNNNTYCSKNQAGKITRPLLEGPSLISIPLVQSNESIEKVLQTVKFDKAWTYVSSGEKWVSYAKSKPYKGDLKTINHTMGVWVSVTESSNLTVAGLVPEETVILLHAGWNLIGFPSFQNDYTFADLTFEINANRMEAYDHLAHPYYLKISKDSDFLLTL
ncbi:MAG: hypothetical protein KAW09_03720, partial [Thermoplasmata archaeon]|nr:hypothetical protein [Thermoplasmata archaeon]